MSLAPVIDLSQVQNIGDRIIAQINALREIAPIYWNESDNAWIVSGHAEVAEGFRGTLPLSGARHKLLTTSPQKNRLERLLPNTFKYYPRFLINLDPPEHTRVRKLMMKAFSRKVAEDYRPLARQVIVEVLDRLDGRDQIEFVEDVGRQITGRNIMRITGFADEEFYLPKLKNWAYLANAGGNPYATEDILVQTDAAFGEMAVAFRTEIQARRQNPTDDFISMLVHAGEDQEPLSDEELIGELILILLAGHDTTLNTMALSINALSKDSSAREFIRARPDSIQNAVMELMRFIAMSTQMTRIVSEDFDWKGHSLKQGQRVNLMIAGANRDPRVFPEPERLDLTRNQDANMTFGPGVHHCIGHFFAKMQLTEFFPEFLRRYDSFEVMDDPIRFGGGLGFRGPQELNLRLTRRADL